jgi:putative salt-induced outer membrane protein YdiY
VLQVREEGSDRTSRVPLSALQGVNPPPSVRYKGNLTAGGSVATGNTESRSLFGAGNLEMRSEKHRLTLSGRSNYAESDDTLTARNANAFGKYDYFFTQRLFAYGQTLLEEDRLQDLNLRATFGAGLGYQFFDTNRLALYAEAGPSYVSENYENSENRRYVSGRWSVRFDWQIVPDRVKFFHFHEAYVSVEDTEDFYIRSEQGFRLPLIDKFFFNIQMDYDYKNKPAAGKKNTDLRYLLGLGYAFSN